MINHVIDYFQYLKDTFEDNIHFDLKWLENTTINKEKDFPKQKEFLVLKEKIKNCHFCNLSENNLNPIIGDGNLNAKIFIVVGIPSNNDSKAGKPLTDEAGILFDKMLAAIGLTRNDVYITNVLKCATVPGDNEISKKIAACSNFVYQQIKIVNPNIILCMGEEAIHTILQRSKKVSELRNRVLKPKHKNYKILVTYSPEFLLKNPTFKQYAWEDLQLLQKEFMAL